MTIDEVKNKVHKLVEESYNNNNVSIPWSGMHNDVVDRIMNLIHIWTTEGKTKFSAKETKHFANGFHEGDWESD